MKWIKLTDSDKKIWHRWFAWHPVCVGIRLDGSRDIVWFEWVKRCGEKYSGMEGVYWWWQYKPFLST